MIKDKKVLVAYFSCSGVTAKAAKTVAEMAGADLFEIMPKVPYTHADLDWMNKNSRSSVEMADKSSRPQIANKLENMDEYFAVFIGFPIWWYIAPTIINTFIESYDMKGKIIIPFATSGSSGMGDSVKYLKSSCPSGALWKEGKLLKGSISKEEIRKWIEESLKS